MNRRFHVTIDADTAVAGKVPYGGCDDAGKLHLAFEAKEIRFGDLTPWLGFAGQNPYDETYRRPWPLH